MTGRQQYKDRACEFLRKMVSIKSFSFQEEERALFISEYLSDNGIASVRRRNNIICRLIVDESHPTLLLNSHIDTVQPSEQYSFDPFNPPTDVGRILGLGSNDAGASVAAMLHTFLYFHDHSQELKFNLVLALSAEEERSGEHGMKMIAPLLEEYADCAIIGEPTSMQAAIAERGL
ncbi:MAG: M20/M25/M40 family metallo-hydrolase, partial [Bacteroidales bacterium]|nr:M20/M25/M40 family metallo-hydrolase [Bacteroidales bacterium]